MPGKVHYETAERIATITLDNPAALNAFDHAMCRELRRIWADVEANPDVVCAIVTGAGEKAFCTGWDVSSLATRREREARVGRSLVGAVRPHHRAPEPLLEAGHHRRQRRLQRRRPPLHRGQRAGDRLRERVVPGHARGGGHPLGARAGGARAADPARTRLSARAARKHGRITAHEALALGLVGEVVPAPQLMPRARETAAVIAQHSPTALARTQARDLGEPGPRPERGPRRRPRTDRAAPGTSGSGGGSKAFLEKRAPKWAPYRGTD